MRVMCIQEGNQLHSNPVVVGEFYNVVKVVRLDWHAKKGEFYELKERDLNYYYHDLFAPIEDHDRAEAITSINQLTAVRC